MFLSLERGIAKTHVLNWNYFGSDQNGNDQKLHGHSVHHAKKWNVEKGAPCAKDAIKSSGLLTNSCEFEWETVWVHFKKFWMSSKNS